MNPRNEHPDFENFRIVSIPPREEWERTKWALWGDGEYPESSVLAGQFRSLALEYFDSEAEARQDYPGVPMDGFVPMPSTAIVPICPPGDWSPMDAGESWEADA